MRRYGDLDDKDLVDTHRWKTIESASRYAQTVVHEAARKADLFPTPPVAPDVHTTRSASQDWWKIRGNARKSRAKYLISARLSGIPSHGRGRRFNPYSAHHWQLNILIYKHFSTKILA